MNVHALMYSTLNICRHILSRIFINMHTYACEDGLQ